MNIPPWIQACVADFGKQLGLDPWELSSAGTAGFLFEDGTEIQLEVTSERLYFLLLRAYDGSLQTLQQLLQSAHLARQHKVAVRAAVLPRRNMAMWVSSCALQEVTLPQLEALFQAVWEASEVTLKGAADDLA
ncbi:MAG: hypothetical protein IJV69_06930 [Kiritimatiellae bacterium]|nr:hypothetical protein [Kiritimatiellia bacterium]